LKIIELILFDIQAYSRNVTKNNTFEKFNMTKYFISIISYKFVYMFICYVDILLHLNYVRDNFKKFPELSDIIYL